MNLVPSVDHLCRAGQHLCTVSGLDIRAAAMKKSSLAPVCTIEVSQSRNCASRVFCEESRA